MARIISASGAFQACITTAINGGGTFGGTTIAPYQSCGTEPFYNANASSQEWGARQIYRSVNDLTMSCSSTQGNAETGDIHGWGHQYAETMNWNGGWLDSIFVTLNNQLCSVNPAAGCRLAAYPWPYSALAGILLHEAAHTHSYGHGHNSNNATAQTVCGRSGSWHFQTNTMPYLLQACHEVIVARSTTICGPINQGCSGGFRLIASDGTNCQCVSDPGWTVIGGAAGAIAASDYGVFAVYPGNGQLMRYTSGQTWTSIGGPWTQFVTNDTALYARSSSGVFVYSGAGTTWTQIGGPASQLVAGGTSLYAVDTTNTAIYRYDGTPNSWTAIGGGGAQFVASDNKLFARTTAGTGVMEYLGSPYVWQQIGGGSTNLIVGGTYLYSSEPNTGNVYRYLGSTWNWQYVGGPAAQFVGNRDGLLGRASSGPITYKLGHTTTYWTPAGFSLSEIAGGGNRLIGRHSSGDILLVDPNAVGGGY